MSDATPQQAANTIREAHAKAMEALAADVHPYSATAIREHEAAIDAALKVLEDAEEEWRDKYQSQYDLLCEAIRRGEAAVARADTLTQERDEAHKRLTELHAAGMDSDGREWTLSERITHLKHIWYMRGYNAKSNDRVDLAERFKELEVRAWAIFNPDATLDHVEVAKLYAHLSALAAATPDTQEPADA